jgi:menaquinone-dependent protoporphyrinogen oxidase
MPARILVAYATKHDSTREVADDVARRLRDGGFDVHLRPAADVAELDPYDAVVLGGALYTGRWHRDARGFLAKHRSTLASLPFAVFAMGPKTMDDEAVAGSRQQLDAALAKAPGIHPVSIAVFGGVVRPEALHFPFNRMPATDARDWDEIRAWATELGEVFARAGTGAR